MGLRRILRFQLVNAVVVSAFVLVPLIAGTALSIHQARSMQRQEAQTAAGLLQRQLSTMLDSSKTAARNVLPIAQQSCAELMPTLLREVAVFPYLRSINVLDNDVITCSSASLVINEPLSAFAGGPRQVPSDGPWGRMTMGSPLVPDSPALLLGFPVSDGRSVVAVIDGRYFLDILKSIVPLNVIQQVELQFDGSAPLYAVPQEAVEREGDGLGAVLVAMKIEGEVPVRARFFERRQGYNELLIDNLLGIMPVAIGASILVAWLIRVFMLRMLSDRERLLRAIQKDEFRVVYQPQVNIASGRCEGVEALLRWERRPGLFVQPDIFIAMAEAEGVIVALTLHLLELVAEDVRTWPVAPGFHLGVNFAAGHVSMPDIVSDVQHFVRDLANPNIRMSLELTERDLVSNRLAAARNLQVLRDAGVQVAIDDFGTGYCSLSYLEELPLDILKIDKGFVQSVKASGDKAVVLDAIIGLGKGLGASLVAEGVESAEQMAYLQAHGVKVIQGYIFAKPMPAEAFLEWYARSEQDIAAILSP